MDTVVEKIQLLNYNVYAISSGLKQYASSSDQISSSLQEISKTLLDLNHELVKSQNTLVNQPWFQVFQIFAVLGTVAAAWFSWQAVKQAEEIALKPIMALGGCDYISDSFSVEVKNISKEGERWARNIEISILGSSVKKMLPGYLGPGNEKTFSFKIGKEQWQGRTLQLSYFTVSGRMYKIKYQLAKDTVKASSIHSESTHINIERLN